MFPAGITTPDTRLPQRQSCSTRRQNHPRCFSLELLETHTPLSSSSFPPQPSRVQEKHPGRRGRRGLEANISLMKMVLKLLLSSTPKCKNTSKEIDFLPLYCPSFYSKPLHFWQLEWQNSTVAFFFFISVRKFYREACIVFCPLVCFAGWFWFVFILVCLVWFGVVVIMFCFVCLFFPEWGNENVKENIPKKTPKLYSGNCIGSLKMLEVVEISIQENLK